MCPTCGWYNGPSSKWIAPQKSGTNPLTGSPFAPGDVGQPFGTGYYDYTFLFNLPSGLALNTLVLIGNWWTDNTGNTVTLNGFDLGLSSSSLSVPSPINVSGAVLASHLSTGSQQNTLVFHVYNGPAPSPTGLRVEAAFVELPEPGTFAVVAAGLLSLAAFARRRRTC